MRFFEETIIYSEEVRALIAIVEPASVRVVDTASDLIFYLTSIEKRWYITIIDRVTTDCSA